MKPSSIILAGGTGFLGAVLARHFVAQGHEVVVLSRRPSRSGDATRMLAWDGRTLGAWASALNGAEVLINLAGRSVDCRYHARNRRLILDSRVESSRVLGEAVARCEHPPRVWLNSSTATIYKHSLTQPMDESGEIAATPEAKDAFSIEVAQAWERAFREAPAPHTRKVALRTAMVLSARPRTVLDVLLRLARLGLGGRMGDGRQFLSWIHEEDFCRALDWLIEGEDLEGPVNVAAPGPLPNAEAMAALRRVAGAPFGLPARHWMLEVGAFVLRTETELIIKSRRVVPGRLLASGFEFRFSDFASAVHDLARRRAGL